jgi:drug/metabolite transporter (DMT)-like permease
VLTSTDIKKLKNIYTAKGVKESLITLVLWGIYFFIIGRVSKNLSSIPGMAKIVVAANIFIFTSVINGFLMAGFAAYKHGVTSINDLKTRYVLPLFLVNLFLYTFAWLVINYGLTQDLVSLVAPVSSLYPAITVLLAGFFLKEKLVLNQKIGILTILGGIFLISI